MRHRHQWAVVGWTVVDVYGDGFGFMTEFPTSFRTNITLRCVDCGDVKLKKRRGRFSPPLTASPSSGQEQTT